MFQHPKAKRPKTHRVDGGAIGVLVGIKDSGEPIVDFPANTTVNHLPARSTVAIEIIRQGVVLLFRERRPPTTHCGWTYTVSRKGTV